MGSQEKVSARESVVSFESLFLSKTIFGEYAKELHGRHKHDVNALVNFLTAALALWSSIILALDKDQIGLVYGYAAIVALTTPLKTALCHTAMVISIVFIPQLQPNALGLDISFISAIAITGGYLVQEIIRIVCGEETTISSLTGSDSTKLILYLLYQMPSAIEGIFTRKLFLPWMVTRNRMFCVPVASKESIDMLRKWINENVAYTNETTHLWPHEQEETTGPVRALENDAALYAAFRKIFPAKHFDVRPIQGMNEIYVTAVGKKKPMSSDAVFYTPHVDGPYFWTPFSRCYRCLVGATQNKMVQTKFNLQHDSKDQVLGLYDVLGFDYNRELHWINHIHGEKNQERRSVIKLHYVVYPKGWHWYGNIVANLNQNYNTWARGNFLRTLRPAGIYEKSMAWWIWLTTWFNSMFVEYFGWDNLIYISLTYALGPLAFLILTSFRHYAVYMTSFAFRDPPIAHGYLMRDAKLYKTIALCHLGCRLLPVVELPRDLPGLCLAVTGFGISILATARLGLVRTYFGSELGFVKPKWIEGFPYGYIPHPMIMGQLFAYSTILWWWNSVVTFETAALISTHMSLYTIHMIQEMITSSY
eukprot:CAMPEP_0194132504 /NCGR_PEP_ID=MMETSP0152-20130528/2952_1 /TAXON_ID=1049557 /ORGANISM="Thalassiothrix antarctica, Strain L6-D1" /LENGTH=590 /DNA_ID=CAMNT_0038827573 /DNA_START=125 /DNA_END=1897 /DNA_ORIENTATION=-